MNVEMTESEAARESEYGELEVERSVKNSSQRGVKGEAGSKRPCVSGIVD